MADYATNASPPATTTAAQVHVGGSKPAWYEMVELGHPKMTLVAFDTLAVVKRLVAAGFTDQQAEAVTLVVRDAQDVDLSTLAIKTDLAETKAEILKWMVGSMGIQTVVIIGAVLALVRMSSHQESSWLG